MRIFNAIKLLSISSEREVVVKNVAARLLTRQHSLQMLMDCSRLNQQPPVAGMFYVRVPANSCKLLQIGPGR